MSHHICDWWSTIYVTDGPPYMYMWLIHHICDWWSTIYVTDGPPYMCLIHHICDWSTIYVTDPPYMWLIHHICDWCSTIYVTDPQWTHTRLQVIEMDEDHNWSRGQKADVHMFSISHLMSAGLVITLPYTRLYLLMYHILQAWVLIHAKYDL